MLMLRCLLLLLVAAALAPPAAPHSHKTKSLEIVHPWARASAKDATTSARVFMTVKSLSGRPDRLISASTTRAGKVELHDAGKGAAAFSVGRGKDLVLYGDGPSLVLSGLKSPLHAYDDFTMTLVFERAGRVEIVVMVEE
jgi:periplasmic copper chaperone A